MYGVITSLFCCLFMAPLPRQPDPDFRARGFLGVQVQEKDGKVMVMRVVVDGPCDYAGLKENDHILSIRGVKISSDTQVSDVAKSSRPGSVIEIEAQRMNEKKVFKIKVGAYPVSLQ